MRRDFEGVQIILWECAGRHDVGVGAKYRAVDDRSKVADYK